MTLSMCTGSRPSPSRISRSVLALMLLVVGCMAFATNRSAMATTKDLPELWVHGIAMQPERLKPINASGARMFVDLRSLDGSGARAHLARYHNLGLGIFLTLRWKDPDNRHGPDAAPTTNERVQKTEMLMEILTSPEAKQMEGKIWIQFFNEVAGGPGSINPDEADTMFGWATETALRIRREAPHVKICGPALTALDNLEKDTRTLTRIGKLRRDGLMRSIAWSAKYADAIDLHLHLADGDTARRWIKLLRGLLDKEPGGEECDILSLEWSPARYEPQSDLDGAREALIDIYRAMAEADFPIAAYACFYPALNIGQIFHWQSVVTTEGQPNEPFYSTLASIGAGKLDLGIPGRGGDGDNSTGGDGDPPNSEDLIAVDTQLWVSGGLGTPQQIAQLGAAGVHGTLQLPEVTRRNVTDTFRSHARLDLGVALTLRWPDPSDPVAYDSIPNRRYLRQKSAQLIQAMNSRYGKSLAERDQLWIQFGAEIAGDEGAWRMEDADQFFDIATELRDAIAKRHDNVRFVGPAITNASFLGMERLSGRDLERKQLLERAIEWSVKNAHAVDLRLRGINSAELESLVTLVRAEMKKHENGAEMPIICLAWNAADAGEKGEPAELEASMRSVWERMVELEVNLGAYGPLFPVPQSPDADENWVALIATEGSALQPFHDTFIALAKALGQQPLDMGGSDPSGAGEGTGDEQAGRDLDRSGQSDTSARVVRSWRGRTNR